MRAPTNYAGPRREVKKRKQVSQSIARKLSTPTKDVRQILEAKGSLVISVRQDESVQSVIHVLRKERIGAVVVLDEAGKIDGIVSERDIVRKISELGESVIASKVADIMTRNVKTCSPEQSLADVLQTMSDGRFRHLPVVENEKLIGIVTIGDVVKHRVEEVEQAMLGMKQVIVG